MKNNILTALVVFFITVTGLLVIDDLTYNSDKTVETPREEVNVYEAEQQSDLATLDQTE